MENSLKDLSKTFRPITGLHSGFISLLCVIIWAGLPLHHPRTQLWRLPRQRREHKKSFWRKNQRSKDLPESLAKNGGRSSAPSARSKWGSTSPGDERGHVSGIQWSSITDDQWSAPSNDQWRSTSIDQRRSKPWGHSLLSVSSVSWSIDEAQPWVPLIWHHNHFLIPTLSTL